MTAPEQMPRVIHLRPRASSGEGTPNEPNAVFTEPPEPLDWLSEIATEHWRREAALRELRPSDLPEFAAYCETLAEFQESSDMIKDVGLVVPDPETGLPTANPLTMIRDRADRKIAFWANRFRGR
ncbi:terminase small subunit [Gordonia phage Morgana]|uniref:Terminase small subunit n=1 Tax=Gordonia phage Morgana TaxID=3137292 RepID=A0AAX4RAK8_9CAUD